MLGQSVFVRRSLGRRVATETATRDPSRFAASVSRSFLAGILERLHRAFAASNVAPFALAVACTACAAHGGKPVAAPAGAAPVRATPTPVPVSRTIVTPHDAQSVEE